MTNMTAQDLYHCDCCVHAANHYGTGCDINLLYPVLLIMANRRECPDHEYDPEKARAALADVKNE